MKLFLSTDIEGSAGVVDWEQVMPGARAYEEGRRLLLAEVNAAIEGARAGGAEELLVNDAHSSMWNFPPDELAGEADYLSGSYKPDYMMQGLDGSFDLAFLVAYHGSAAISSTLSHTYSPRVFSEVRLNGQVVGESGVNALAALAHGVPVALVSGDRRTAEEAESLFPGAELVVVKESVSRMAARSVHPRRARAMLREAAERAVRNAGSLRPPAIDLPATLEVEFRTEDMAAMAAWIEGWERTGARRARAGTADPLRLYRSFIAVVYLTKSLADAV
ncbi:MAG: M55 family metallopeptidase [Candidatus Dormiibacterota bacterium]